jgi:hypothetical protein
MTKQCNVIKDFAYDQGLSLDDGGMLFTEQYGGAFRKLQRAWEGEEEEVEYVKDTRPLYHILWLEGRNLMKDGRKIRGFRSKVEAVESLEKARGKGFVIVG